MPERRPPTAQPGRRVATLLLADVLWAGSPVFDDVAVNAALARWQEIGASAIRANTGELLRLGSERGRMLATFRRGTSAVKAAIAWQRSILAEDWPPDHAPTPRIVLHTAELDTEAEPLPGGVLALVSEILSRARPGQVVCSRTTALVVVDDLPPGASLTELEGTTASDEAYLVSHPDEVSPGAVAADRPIREAIGTTLPAALARLERGPFVGRRPERERLADALEATRRGELRVAVIAGEPGIGKTRLAAELGLQAFSEGATVLYGRCDEELRISYLPFVDALRQYFAAAPVTDPRLSDSIRDVVRLLPELRQRGQTERALSISDGEADRLRLFSAIERLLAVASASQPLVLILDDLQWAARPTLLLLRHLVRAPDSFPLLMLCTYRDTDVDVADPITGVLGELRRSPRVEWMALEGLGDDDVILLVEQLVALGPNKQAAALARELRSRTAGNPFYVVEMCRHLEDAGSEGAAPDRWGPSPVPESVLEVVRWRLARLDPATRRVLNLAAVVGIEFDLRVVEVVAKLASMSENVLDALEDAAKAKVVLEIAGVPGRYRFAHALVRQALYERRPTVRRQRLHAWIAAAIESVYGAPSDERCAELAYHLVQAKDQAVSDRLVEYARRAGDHAMRQLGYEEAAYHYRSALDALSRTSPSETSTVCDLLIALGEALSWGGQRGDAAGAFREAIEQARAVGAHEQLARAVFGLAWWVAEPGTPDPAIRASLEEAVSLVGPGYELLQARMLARLAMELSRAGRLDHATSVSNDAVVFARAAAESTTLRYVLGERRQLLGNSADPRVRFAVDDQFVALAEESGDTRIAISGHGWRFHDLLIVGDVPGAAAEIEVVSEAVERLGLTDYAYPLLWRATLALLEGRMADAVHFHDKAAETARRAQDPLTLMACTSQNFALRREQGRLPELQDQLVASAGGSPRLQGIEHLLALLYVETGQLSEAAHIFDVMASDEFRHVADPALLAFSATVCAALNDRQRAEMLYPLLLPWAGQNAVTPSGHSFDGAFSHHLGTLAEALGNANAAAAHFEAALTEHRRIGAVPWWIRTAVRFSSVLGNSRRRADRERAAELLAEAEALALPLGMEHQLRR